MRKEVGDVEEAGIWDGGSMRKQSWYAYIIKQLRDEFVPVKAAGPRGMSERERVGGIGSGRERDEMRHEIERNGKWRSWTQIFLSNLSRVRGII